MPEEKEESTAFKVVDRRLFSEDGKVREAPREDARDSEPASKPSPSSATSPAAATYEPQGEPGGFEAMVQFLGTTALFQLGLMQGPGGEAIPADLASARQTIYMLEVLGRKTRGNLTAEEAKLLEDVLYELRMSYVELDQRRAKKSK